MSSPALQGTPDRQASRSPVKQSTSWAHETSSPAQAKSAGHRRRSMDVDQEIDELISDTEATDAVVSAKPVKQSRKIAKDDEEEGVCRWKDCDARYETANELGDHMNGFHIGEKKPWICRWEDCIRYGQMQASKFQLTTHCRSHTGEKPFLCTHEGCDKAFMRNDALAKHLKSHVDSAVAVPDPAGDKDAETTPAGKKTTKGKPKGKGKGSRPSAASKAILEAVEDDLAGSPAPMAGSSRPPSVPPHHPLSSASGLEGRSRRPPSPTPEETYIPQLKFDWVEAAAAGLYQDIDLADVVTSIQQSEPWWYITPTDARLADSIRQRYPRPPTPPLEEDDDFDEGVSRTFPAETAVTGIMETDTGEEVRVLTRPRWQVKYVMAKAKLMLVDEENKMRRAQLKDWQEREQLMMSGEEMTKLGPQGEAFAEVVREEYKRRYGHYPDPGL